MTIRVYVNATPVDVEAGLTAIECVRAWRSGEAEAVEAGTRIIADSRGLPISMDAPARAGSIYRTIGTRPSAPG